MLNKEDITITSKVLEEEFIPNLMILFNPVKEAIYMLSHLQEIFIPNNQGIFTFNNQGIFTFNNQGIIMFNNQGIFTFNNQGIFTFNNQGQIFMADNLELISMDAHLEETFMFHHQEKILIIKILLEETFILNLLKEIILITNLEEI